MDYRAKIKPYSSASTIFGTDDNGIMGILKKQGELLFPYTPIIDFSAGADYETYDFEHTNYKYMAYSKSAIDNIGVTAYFTSQTKQEAEHTLAVMHFFKSIIKSYFGSKNGQLAGSPPPIVRFSYLGDGMFKETPIIIQKYSFILEDKVDYVFVEKHNSYVPVKLQLSFSALPYYNPAKLRSTFSIKDFRNGKLLKDGYL